MTGIAYLLATGRTHSFEFFPPKTDAEQATLGATLRDLEPLAPSFVSVTYRGGAESRKRTFDLVTGMLRTTTLVPMAHLICVAHSRLQLAAKLELADFAVTQFFFEADSYTGLVADLATRGVDKPVLPGIMPVTSLSSIPRMAAMGGPVPTWMVARLEEADRRGGKEAVRDEGVAIATELCEQLLAAGVPGLHFYTLNRSRATREIYTALGLAAP